MSVLTWSHSKYTVSSHTGLGSQGNFSRPRAMHRETCRDQWAQLSPRCICTSLYGTLGPGAPLPVPRERPVLPSLLEAGQQHLCVLVSGMQRGLQDMRSLLWTLGSWPISYLSGWAGLSAAIITTSDLIAPSPEQRAYPVFSYFCAGFSP